MAEIFTVEIHTDDLEHNEIAYSGDSFFEAKDVFYRLLLDEKRPFFLGCVQPNKRAGVIYSHPHVMTNEARMRAAQSLRDRGII